MVQQSDVMQLVSDLKQRGEAFVLATVVRTVAVTAAKAGAKAVIMPDGTITGGWIGGGCSGVGTCTLTMDAGKAVTALFGQACTLAKGDVNGNGLVTLSDWVLLGAYIRDDGALCSG